MPGAISIIARRGPPASACSIADPAAAVSYEGLGVLTGATCCRHCERSEAIQSSVPPASASNKLLPGAKSDRAYGGTEDWIASSLRSSQ
jgi:hypothetical protein